MVRVVDQTDCQTYDYRENNEQLAKENGELRQKLGIAIAKENQHSDELHRKNLEIVNLKSRINELASIKVKYDKIAFVVLGEIPLADEQDTNRTLRASESIRAIEPAKSIESSTCDSSQSSSSTCSADSIVDNETSQQESDPLHHISEVSERNSTIPASLLTPRPRKDSLEPSCATSVPDIFERTPCTPSIFHLMSNLESPARCDPVATSHTRNDDNDISSLKDHGIENPDNNNTIITNISNIEPNVNNIGPTTVDCSPFSPNDDLSFRKTHPKQNQQQALYSSTPVQIKSAQRQIDEPLAVGTRKKLVSKKTNSAKGNQENVSEPNKPKEEPQKGGRKRGANKALGSEPQPPAKRYNLRSRAN